MDPMHEPSQFDLLKQRRFAPFFWTQFLGAANDNLYKNALILFVVFHAVGVAGMSSNALVNIAGAVFIAPFILLSAVSGQLADKFEKSRLIRLIKLLEITIMLVGLAGFWMQSLSLLMLALALLGVHSTLFGPVKYAILPQHLKPDELIGGNGLVEMGTFVAVLLGTIFGGILVAIPGSGPIISGGCAVVVAVSGYFVSRGIPNTPAVAPDLRIDWNPFTGTWANIVIAKKNRVVWLSLLGISWFWYYGSILLAQFPGFAKDVLGGDEHVVTLLLALFSVGIGLGSLLCEKLSGRKVELGLVPFGSIGLSVFAFDLWLASRHLHPTEVVGITHFLAKPAHWRITFDLVLLGVFGGFYIVPLYALIQQRSDPTQRSRIIAANNIVNALFMVASAGVAIGLLSAGLTIPQLLLATGVMNAAVAVFIYGLVPEFLMRFLAWMLVHTIYRVRARGLEHIPEDGPCIVVCNHVSFVDAVAISACVRRPIRFLMDHQIFRIPVLSFIFRSMNAIPIASEKEDPAMKKRAFEKAAEALAAGEIVGIFPEGRLTENGELNPFRPGVLQIIAATPVPVIPIALSGLWGSFFSRSANGQAMRRFRGVFSRIALTVGEPIPPEQVTIEGLQRTVLELRGEQR